MCVKNVALAEVARALREVNRDRLSNAYDNLLQGHAMMNATANWKAWRARPEAGRFRAGRRLMIGGAKVPPVPAVSAAAGVPVA